MITRIICAVKPFHSWNVFKLHALLLIWPTSCSSQIFKTNLRDKRFSIYNLLEQYFCPAFSVTLLIYSYLDLTFHCFSWCVELSWPFRKLLFSTYCTFIYKYSDFFSLLTRWSHEYVQGQGDGQFQKLVVSLREIMQLEKIEIFNILFFSTKLVYELSL